MEVVLEVSHAFGDDAANPVVGPLEGAQFYGEEVRKDEMISSVGRLRKVGVQDSSDIAPLGHKGVGAVLAVSAYGCAPRS